MNRVKPHRFVAFVGGATCLLSLVLAGCTSPQTSAETQTSVNRTAGTSSSSTTAPPARATTASPTTGTGGTAAPYAQTGAGELTGAALHAKRLVYVPNQVAGTLQIIDPATRRVIKRVRVPSSP